jgi:FkbH-like protein
MMIDENSELFRKDIDFAIIWTQPQSVIESFNRILNYENIGISTILKEVDEFCTILKKILTKIKFIFFPTWVVPSYHRGFGMLDMKNSIGIANTLNRMNLCLADNLDDVSNIHIFNSQKWIEVAGKNAFNPKLWYMGKIVYGNDVFKEATTDIKAALQGISGNARKLIILDLDDTLWGGIVGDLGWENLKLGGHDPVGEAFVDFQNELRALTNRGIILGIVSKNEESVALEAIDSHPEMVLRRNDFSGWKINWQDKAQNILDLVTELNLGLQSVVFIDDNRVERARIRETLPDVLVPEWPEDKLLYKRKLLSLACFDTPSISEEDAQRSKMYVLEQKRDELKASVNSLDEWLKTLNVKVKIEELNKNNLQRTTQLLNKTNQMNLSTRRLSESELLNWLAEENRKLWTFRVSDRFGESGLTGILSLECENGKAKIVDYILSCRVFGRKIEETMLHVAVQYAQSKNLTNVYAQYIPTPKNKPCLGFLEKSGFVFDESDSTFHWDAKNEYPVPEQITIERV